MSRQPMHDAILATVLHVLSMSSVRRATKYLSPDSTVKATLQGRRRANARSVTILVTIGKPNYAEREFIVKAKRAGEPFPVKKVQLKHEVER